MVSPGAWLVLDSKGQVSTATDLDKGDKGLVMERVGINARDLRILDPLLSYPSTILRREHAIVLNLEHIKAVVTYREVFLRDPLNEHVVPVVEALQRCLPSTESSGTSAAAPFEFRALEAALRSICDFLDARTAELEATAYPALDDLTTSKISRRNMGLVRQLKGRMTTLTARVQKVRDELEQLLDDDDDMAELFLTRKLGECPASSAVNSIVSFSHTQGDGDIDEVEMLLECYFMQTNATLNKLSALREYADDIEDYINIQLDNHRNRLLQLELVLKSGTLAMAFYSLISGIFGMNIPFPWKYHHGYIFKWVVILGGLFSMLVFSAIMACARSRGLVDI